MGVSAYSIVYFLQRRIFPGFKISKKDLVLDIGSGDRPFWRGDVFLDDLGKDNKQRISGQNTVKHLGLFINDNAARMPFKNKVFDFSFCSHVLEHVDNPKSVIEEIVRVSKQGYLEIPNGITEVIKPFHSHLWIIFYDGKTLYFLRKKQNWENILLKNGELFEPFIQKVQKAFFIRIYWKDKIPYKILKNVYEGKDYQVGNKETKGWIKTNISLYLLIITFMRKLFYKEKSINPKEILKKNPRLKPAK